MAITYSISFFLLFIPIVLIERYIFHASFEMILISTIFITGYSVVMSMENQFVKTIKTVSREIMSRIKK